MDIYQMKKLLRTIKTERIRLSSRVRMKVEKIHNVPIEDVMHNIQNPGNLIEIEEQSSREPHEETYGLIFEKSKNRRLFIVITDKTLEKLIYIVTAYSTSKKVEKLIKRPKIRKMYE